MNLRQNLSRRWRGLQSAWRRVRTRAIRTVLSNSEPEMVALGAAIGVFVAMLPCVGFQMVLAVLIAIALSANRLAAAAMVWVSNPLFFYASYRVGRRLLGWVGLAAVPLQGVSWYDFVGYLGRGLFLSVLVGSVVLGLLSGALTYVLALRIVRYYRERARLRREARLREAAERLSE